VDEGSFGCSLADKQVPFFSDNCAGNNDDLIAFEINLG
jgi:hypothetical protein